MEQEQLAKDLERERKRIEEQLREVQRRDAERTEQARIAELHGPPPRREAGCCIEANS